MFNYCHKIHPAITLRQKYSRTSVAQVYYDCFELVLDPLGKSPIATDLGYLRMIFFFYDINFILCGLIRTHNIPKCYRKSKRYTCTYYTS